MNGTLVLGVGNILLRDDGLGVWAARALRRFLPRDVVVLDGGTLGLDLLPYLDRVARLLIIDAVRAGHVPGTLVRLAGDAIDRMARVVVSPHEVGLPDLLAAAALLDRRPSTVVLWGMEPADLTPGVGLSPIVQHRLPCLIEAVLEELYRWDAPPAAIGRATARPLRRRPATPVVAA
ncbi:MAG: HyaD/HybD family hydrogenase maturation endopeptidase [Armatimonadota bacterium]|nr:HyaD/HybD family hydrogenase maturation endopeptidase [Armatimonadota bacterium]